MKKEKIIKEVEFPLNNDGSIDWKNRIMKKEELYNEAKKDFEEMIKNSTDKEIKEAVSCCGIAAAKFANYYVEANKDNETYKKIYSIYYNYFLKIKLP